MTAVEVLVLCACKDKHVFFHYHVVCVLKNIHVFVLGEEKHLFIFILLSCDLCI